MKNTKRISLIIAFFITGFTTLQAQEIAGNTIGLRFGSNNGFGGEITYQRGLNENNRLEFDLGIRSNNNYSAFKLTGIYQWVWTIEDQFNWFAGVGGGLGSWSYKTGSAFGNNSSTVLYAAGDIGVEYNFDIPLLISLDYRPELGFGDLYDGFNSDVALGLRYQF